MLVVKHYNFPEILQSETSLECNELYIFCCIPQACSLTYQQHPAILANGIEDTPNKANKKVGQYEVFGFEPSGQKAN